jgi:O-antigen/teichoic acid export membrane protein
MTRSDLNTKTVKGFFWSFVENFLSQSVTFVVGVILSRLLSPDLFGLVGMIMIFIAVSEIFVNSGFHQSLIRKQNVGPADFSTIFFTNLVVAFFFWVVLQLIGSTVANFYDQPILAEILPIFGIVVFIDSLALVQKTDLTRRLDFKLLAKISVVSNIVGGVVGIVAAYQGMGVWSLVMKSIFQKLTSTSLLWLQNKWRPIWVFDWKLLKEHFQFGNRLLISGIIDTIFANLYYLVIGKYFSSAEVGYYSRADQFQKLPSSNFSNIISRVSYPVMSGLVNDLEKLRNTFHQILIGSMFLAVPMMFTLAVISDTFVQVLIGEQWLPSVIYLQLLSLIGAFYPVHHLNLLIPQLMNRTDIFLRVELIKKALVVIIVFFGIRYGIQWMLWATLVFNIIAFVIHGFWTQYFISYSLLKQSKDLIAPFFVGGWVAFSIILFRMLLPMENMLLFLILQLVIAIVSFTLVLRVLFKIQYNAIVSLLKNIVANKKS